MIIDLFRGEFGFLSNFWNCKIRYENLDFNSVECAFQAAKTLNLKERLAFTEYDSVKAKKEGRKVTLRSDWNEGRLKIMEELLNIKFRNAYLAKKLLETGDDELIEGNPWGDYFWGVCNAKGENNLGKLLMKIRDNLRKAP